MHGSRHKITNWEAFRDFAEVYGELTTAEMAQVWSEKVSRHTISRGLKKINFTRKKRPTALHLFFQASFIKKEMNNCATHSDTTSNNSTQKI